MVTQGNQAMVLKQELKALGHWKDKPRGNPGKGYQAQRRGSSVD